MANKKSKILTCSLIPLRNLVVFPHMIVPLFIGRQRSLAALAQAMTEGKKLVVAAQKDEVVVEPQSKDICQLGVLVKIEQVLKLADGTTKILVEGEKRVQINRFVQEEPFFRVESSVLESQLVYDEELEKLIRSAVQSFENYVHANKKIPSETLISILNVDDPEKLSDLLASYLLISTKEKQSLLEKFDVKKRLTAIKTILEREIQLLKVDSTLHTKVKDQIEKVQREYYLKEKLKAIQKELGTLAEGSETQEYERKVEEAEMPAEVAKKAQREVQRLNKVPAMSAEAGVIRTYLDWLVELPWQKSTEQTIDVKRVREILDEDHFGLEKVKERIVEYFAVFTLTKKIKGTILCLVGPPGVGKTSVAQAIAKAMGRKLASISLGGVRDQAELRGHRRTYVGAMPGRIIQAIHRIKSPNPVILLDEIDKMSNEFKGDPSAAMMEVLDPQQNKNFVDHYLEVPFDLSNVFFIATANHLHNIPRPLLDRMEVISLSGYSEDEKVEIAKRYIWPTQLKEHGLVAGDIEYTEEGIRSVIRYYTKEAGLRELIRSVAKICRRAAKDKVENNLVYKKFSKHNIHYYLGVSKYEYETQGIVPEMGVVTGLAWTETGGDTIQIEATIMKGKGTLIITGQLGEVMQESAKAALSYVRSKSSDFGLAESFYRHNDIHVHVPEGAIPKDGPSAGIAIATAIASAVANLSIVPQLAMTGEITLRGRVLPVGGLKEKLLAAARASIKKIIFPAGNKKGIKELSAKIKRGLKISFVKNMDEVLQHALRGYAEFIAKQKLSITPPNAYHEGFDETRV